MLPVNSPVLISFFPKRILEKNIEQMKKIMSAFPHVLLRPHLKAHKSSYIARAQAAAGVVRILLFMLYQTFFKLLSGCYITIWFCLYVITAQMISSK